MLELSSFSKLCWDFYIVSVAKIAILSVVKIAKENFQNIICPCLEYCSHPWAGASSFFLGFPLPTTWLLLSQFWAFAKEAVLLA